MSNTKPQAKTELTVDEIYPTWQKVKLTKLGYVLQRVEVVAELQNWHNKEQVKLLERLKEKKFDYTTSEDDSSEEYSIDVVPVSAIQSELTKLKGGVK